MTNKILKAELLKRLGVSKQRLSQRIQAVIRRIPMGTEDATYCIAHDAGLRLDKYVDKETVGRVRALVAALRPSSPSAPSKLSVPREAKLREVRIGRNLAVSDPILPTRIINEAKEISEHVYPVLYIFENSVREVIRRILTRDVGGDWWERCASSDVQRTITRRMAEESEIPWHSARGAHPIFYTDIKELLSIVRNNEAWPKLRPVLGTIEWFSQLIGCISASRNPIAHMNPISRQDRDRVNINFQDWELVIKARRSIIPLS
jgi:Swt1-like HEPN